MSFEVEDPNAPAPRMCHLTRWPDFDGYGFNLHSDKTRPGQFIGKVDADSPAEAAGLKKGDRIVEVNGVNIANENHKQVVERIKTVKDETRLLVVDAETDAWYRQHKIVIRGTLKNVIYLQSPVTRTPAHVHHTTTITTTTAAVVEDPPGYDLIDEKAPPIPAADRRASVRSADAPSKSGSQHTPSPPPVPRKKSSITAPDPKEFDFELRVTTPADYPKPEPPKETSDFLASRDSTGSEPKMVESYQERTTSVDVHETRDELASKLVGFRVVDHDQVDGDSGAPPMPSSAIPELKSSMVVHHDGPVHSQVHFSPSTANSLDESEKARDVPKPDRPDSGTVREELFEKVEHHRVPEFSPVLQRATVVEDLSRKSSENGDSSSNSSRSVETGSYQLAGKHYDTKENHDDLGFDETKTPSPSPAVVPDSYRPTISPPATNGFHAAVATTTSEKAPAPPVPTERTVAKAASSPAPAAATSTFSGLASLNVTAQEMRETLARRRKVDPRTQAIDMRKKHELVNNM